jgi:thioredoxin 1
MSQYTKELNEAEFEDLVLQSEKPVLVDFWAPWCAPCRAMTPAVEAVAQKWGQDATVVKINVDDNPSVSARYNIRGIPTVILFRDGKEANRIVGLASQEQLSQLVRQN